MTIDYHRAGTQLVLMEIVGVLFGVLYVSVWPRCEMRGKQTP